MQGWVASSVRQYVNSLPLGQMFSTRECLNFGKRSAVDQQLYRMVKRAEIIRLARGVFIKLTWKMDYPSPYEIAMFKAKAFGRRALPLPDPEKTNFSVETTRQGLPVATDGATSSFGTYRERVHLLGRAPRKLALGNSMHAVVIRTLWEVGKDNVSIPLIRKLTAPLSRTENALLRHSCHVMPEWMANLLIWQSHTVSLLTA